MSRVERLGFQSEWKYSYPLTNKDTNTFSNRIKDYRRLSVEDKKILVNDPLEFQRYIFWHQNLPVPTRDQMFMMEHLANACLSKEQDPEMLQAQRGLAKSLTVQICVVWLLLRNKDEKIVVVSATGRRAESFTLFCLNMIRSIPLLMHLYPNTDQRSSGGKFDVAGRTPDDSPSVAAFGVTGAKTGSRASLIIYDDVEIPENSITAQMREKLLHGVRDTSNLGISGQFREICICTPQSSESVYNVMREEDKFNCVIIPSEYPDDIEVYNGCLAEHIETICKEKPELIGLNTDIRQNMKHLNKQKLKGKARYKLQYMLDTTLTDAEKYPLKLADLIVMDLDLKVAPTHIEYSSEAKHAIFDLKHSGFRGDGLYAPRYYNDERREYEGVAMFIDPSGRGDDETAWCVTAQLGGRIFLLGLGGLQGGYDEATLNALANIALRFNVNLVQIESNFGDGAFGELLKPILRSTHNCAVEDVRATTQKETRIIDALEPTMMQHRLVVNKDIFTDDLQKPKQDYRFTYQLTHLTAVKGSLKHDDIIDCVGMGVAYWVESLARDTKEEAERYKREQKEKELAAYIAKYGGGRSRNVMNNY